MPRPHQPTHYELELIRKIDSLGIKVLQLNAQLRLKVIYAQRLEVLVGERNKRIDSLYALLEQARRQNAKLEAEAEHLAGLIAAPTDGGLAA